MSTTVVEKTTANINRVLGTVLDAAPIGFLLIDSAGRIKHYNKHCEGLFGFTKQELLGESIELLLPEQLRDTHITMRDNFIAAPWPRMMGTGRELFAQRKDGSQFPIEIGLGPRGKCISPPR